MSDRRPESGGVGELARAVGVAPRDLRVVAVHAHPDDETLFTGATLAALVDAGAHVTLVTCTAGEASGQRPEERTEESDAAIRDARLAELDAACRVLGVRDRVLLGRGRWRDSGWYPSRCGLSDLFAYVGGDGVEQLAVILRRERPHVVLTCEPEGITRHPDHVRAHRLVVEAVDRIAASGTDRAVMVLGALVPQAWLDRGRVVLDGLLGSDEGARVGSGGLVGYRGTVALTIGSTSWADAKRRALACHLSQTPGPSVRAMITNGGRRGDTLLLCAIADGLGDAWAVEPYTVVRRGTGSPPGSVGEPGPAEEPGLAEESGLAGLSESAGRRSPIRRSDAGVDG